MNKGAGLAVVVAVAVAALRLSPSTATQPVAAPSTAHASMDTPPHRKAAPLPYVGECAAYSEAPATTKKDSPQREDYAGARHAINRFFGLASNEPTEASLKKLQSVHFAVAVVPDPRHTHLSLMFDRSMVAIQQAAQDEGYLYTASWMPWSGETETFPRLADTQIAEDLRDHRESCPGLLLFRKSSAFSPLADTLDAKAKAQFPYENALVVLVVGEQPTAGIQAAQWINAFRFLCASAFDPATIRVLGPTFTGSLDSLNRLLTTLPGAHHDNMQILSGSISDCSAVHRFNLTHANFGTFQESDSLHLYRFLKYLDSQATPAKDTAILSEDETSYGALGNEVSKPPPADGCEAKYPYENRPLRLFYPRDMSALRAQYQKQGVFSTPEAAGAHAGRSTLQDDDGDDGNTNASDTIPTYSQTVNPLAQEALLYGVVSQLRTHHTRYLVLRCTNPLDYLFLTRFFHRAYPDARIVLLGQDMLLRREIDTTEFRGVLSIANYPLLPRDQHWTTLYSDVLKTDQSKTDWQQDDPSHSHLIFDSHLNQGTYIAARYTFDWDMPALTPNGDGAPLRLPRKPLLSGYTDPFWLKDPTPSPDKLATHPPTWITVVGRDGFWPVAVLNEDTTSKLPIDSSEADQWTKEPDSIITNLIDIDAVVYGRPMHYLLKQRSTWFDTTLYFDLPLPWRICGLLALLLLGYQLIGIRFGADGAIVGFVNVFQEDSSNRQSVLLAVSCATIVFFLADIASIQFAIGNLDLILNLGWDLWLCFVAPLAAMAAISHVLLGKNLRNFKDLMNLREWKVPIILDTLKRWKAFFCFVGFIVLMGLAYYWGRPHIQHNAAIAVPLFYRMGHLTAGISPLLPVLFITLGVYLTVWQNMAGNLLLGDTRPRLPSLVSGNFARISRRMECGIRSIARPFAVKITVVAPATVVAIALAFLFTGIFRFTGNLPLISLEGIHFNVVFNLFFLASFVLLVLECGRLFWTWIEFRKLLRALNRFRLRRTFAHLRAVPSTSLWGMGGSARSAQIQFFASQMDAFERLMIHSRVYPITIPTGTLQQCLEYGRMFLSKSTTVTSSSPAWASGLDGSLKDGSLKLDNGQKLPADNIRELMASATAIVLQEILANHWGREKNSLDLETIATGVEDRERKVSDMKLSANPTIATAEEFVCFHYIAYIQNILARMRTIVLSMILLFVSVCFAIASYPFIPRTQVALWMVLGLLLIGTTVIYVYAGMERDETLSYITNTKPGHLGPEFYIKTASFLAGPIIGILATQFPGLADSVLGWFQPGLIH